MTINIEFAGNTPTPKEVKTYTGDASKWPDGVYQTKLEDALIVVEGREVRLTTSIHGYLPHDYKWTCKWTRISSNPTISSITFAGAADYPDGKPVDTESEPDPTLSDPCDLKVGDWIQFDNWPEPVKVIRVSDHCLVVKTLYANEYGRPMNGYGYTVVPAPKGEK